MTAVLCVEPGELKLVQRPRPEPSADKVLVKIRRVGLCGTDYHIFEGTQPFLNYPRVMGHELSAEVLDAPAASGFNPGEIVVINPYLACGTCIACRAGKPNCCTRLSVLGVHSDGGMCEALSLPAGNLLSGGGLSVDACATVEFLAIGAHAVRRAQITPGASVLVIGAGPIGLGAAIFARIAGGRVTMLDRDAERLDAARAIAGVSHTILGNADAAAEIARDTGGDNYLFVFDATGSKASMEKGFEYVAHGGTYAFVGLVKDHLSFADAEFHKREMSLLASRNATMADFEHVMAALRAGEIDVDRVVTHRTSVEGVISDLPRWVHDKTGLVKALVEMA